MIRILQKTVSLGFTFSVGISSLMWNNAAYASEMQFDKQSIVLPISLETVFYLTGTPITHSSDESRAVIDFQIPDELGLITKGAPLYAPFDGYATYSESENASGMIEITSNEKQWKIILAHVLNDTKTAKKLNKSYPKHVVKGELISFQGDSGYASSYSRFPVHVHYELFMRQGDEYTGDNGIIDICSQLSLTQYCDYVDKSGKVLLIYDR